VNALLFMTGTQIPRNEHDVIIVGAGVAGAALATVLARDGRRVLAIERDLREPDRIVGELLQPGGCAKLRDLGLEAALEGIDAQQVFGYGLFLEGRRSCIEYNEACREPKNAKAAEQPLLLGRSFHNGRFVRRLRELAQAEPNCELVEGVVTELLFDARPGQRPPRVVGVVYRAGTSSTEQRVAYAALTIACDGCASRLRKQALPSAQHQVPSNFVGLILTECSLPFPGHGHVVLTDRAPVLFYPISSSEVRCLVDVPGGKLPLDANGRQMDLRTYMEQVIGPQIPEPLQHPFLTAVAKEDFRSMPNRVMPARPLALKGAILLGDSFNMRHPLTGGGMTVALSDVALIRRFLRLIPDLHDDEALRFHLELFYRNRRPLSATINILANALYGILCGSPERARKDMRHAFLDYLQLGGRCAADPIRMLGGLEPSPSLLVAHFFAVAVFGCGRVLLPVPTPARLAKAWDLFCTAFNIAKPLIDGEGVTPLAYIPVSRIPAGSGWLICTVFVTLAIFIGYTWIR
jgi:squalene monooxygenase